MASSSPTPSSSADPTAPYQIDYQSDATGKRIASTKRRILFRFGTFNPVTNRPLDQEHVVTLSWSPTSGHTILAADGREVTLRDGQKWPWPKVSGMFEESWILGEERGVTKTNERGIHLRIVAHAAGKNMRRGGRNKQRQFDLFIDGRSYFDLPILNEESGIITAAPALARSYSASDESNPEEVQDGCLDEAVEEWTASSSAIVDSNDDDDADSVDGFMENIHLGAEADAEADADEDGAEGKKKDNKDGSVRKATKSLHRKSSRAAEKIGTSTRNAVAGTSQGAKKLAAGTSKVLTSPMNLMKRRGSNGSSVANQEDPNGDIQGDLSSDSNSNQQGMEERIAPGSFRSMHETIKTHNELSPKQHEQVKEEREETPEEEIARLRDQISHLELEIASNTQRRDAEIERAVAMSEIEAKMLMEEEREEIWRLKTEVKAKNRQNEALRSELSLAKAEAERLRKSEEAAKEKAQSIKLDKESADQEISRLKQRISTLEDELDSVVRANKPRTKGEPFSPSAEAASYLGDPKCCLCFKDATETMKSCQCGKKSCDLRAHVSCLIGTNHSPTPSVSHPGTPAPALPLILCKGIFADDK